MNRSTVALCFVACTLWPTESRAEAGDALHAARKGFVTQRRPSNSGPDGPVKGAAEGPFRVIRFRAPLGDNVAYLTPAPNAGERRPAVLWLHGGFGGIGPNDATQVKPLVDAGLVVMCPSWRGENDNRGRYEMFYGEVDDALAALDHLSHLPYVDPDRIFVVGHSTGGTLALLVAESGVKVRGIVSLGGAPDVERIVANGGYESATPPFPIDEPKEARLRSPLAFVAGVRSPTFYFEGSRAIGERVDVRKLEEAARAANVSLTVDAINGGDHFDIVPPMLTLVAKKINDTQPGVPWTVSHDDARIAYDASVPVTTLRDRTTGFSVGLREPGSQTCVLYPREEATPATCEGIDGEKMLAALPGIATPAAPDGATTAAFAVVRMETSAVSVSLIRLPGEIGLGSPAARAAYVRGLWHGMEPGKVTPRRAKTDDLTVTVNGRPAIKAEWDTDVPPASAILYVLPSGGSTMMLQFMGTKGGTDGARIADAAVRTVESLPPSPSRPAAERDGYADGYAFGRLVGRGFMVFLFVLGVGVAVWTQRKRT